MRILLMSALVILSISFVYAGDLSSQEQFEQGLNAHKSGDIEGALEWYLKAAEQGHPIAQQNLGEMYFFGQGVNRDVDIALEWYLKAAEQGDEIAQFKAGRTYYDRMNFEKSFEWFLKAAEQGHSKSQEMVASQYFTAMGVEENKDAGMKWLKKAAEQGNEAAIELLEIMNNEDN